MTVLTFFTWCENSSLGEAIRESRWLFPVIESFHLLALAMLGGLVLSVNLSLLGLGLGRRPAATIWRDVRPWLTGSILVMIVSGLLLFSSEAVKLYYHQAFWVKMTGLALSLVFTYTLQRSTALADPEKVSPFRSRAVALGSLFLWTIVGSGGRWIGFS